jgi:hypothetical protein
MKKSEYVFLCDYDPCVTKSTSFIYDGKLVYGNDSSSAVEKHILIHLKKHFPQLPKDCSVAQAKKDFPLMEIAFKGSLLKVARNHHLVVFFANDNNNSVARSTSIKSKDCIK